MKTKKVKDLVIPLNEYPHMLYSGTLREAIEKLNVAFETGHHTVLVFDEAQNLVGMLSEKDILKGLEPKFAQQYQKGIPMFWDELLQSESGSEKRLARPVKEFMKKETRVTIDAEHSVFKVWDATEVGWPFKTVAIDAQDSILKASHIMLQEGVYVLPVMEGDKMIGVVRMGDLFYHISRKVLNL
jgi:CBS domain-containing protein